MSMWDRIASLFTAAGRNKILLKRGMEYASANRPEQAIPIYDVLVNSQSASVITRASALLNRALAHSAMKNDARAITDLQEVMAMIGAPDNMVAAAKTKLARVHKRTERRQVRQAAGQKG